MRITSAKKAREAGWVSPAQLSMIKAELWRTIEETKDKYEASIHLASQAAEYADMYKKLLEITTQERIKFFQNDPAGLYKGAMQQLLIGQQFATAFERWRDDRENANLWGDLVETAAAFQHALRLALPS